MTKVVNFLFSINPNFQVEKRKEKLIEKLIIRNNSINLNILYFFILYILLNIKIIKKNYFFLIKRLFLNSSNFEIIKIVKL